jgi:hypothetical protein
MPILAISHRPELRCGIAVVLPDSVVTNPTSVSFTASPDHAALVTGYEIQFYVLVGDVGPFGSQDIGKPTPVDGVITANLVLTGFPSSAVTQYCAYIVSVGDDGESTSTASNNFKVV